MKVFRKISWSTATVEEEIFRRHILKYPLEDENDETEEKTEDIINTNDTNESDRAQIVER